MLELAFKHREELQRKYQEFITTERSKFFYRGFGRQYILNVDDSSSDGIQMVSVGYDGDILGYMGVTINRLTATACSYEAINFVPGNQTYKEDLAQFDINLFTKFGVDRILWSVVVGNPAEKIYDYFADVCGARIVGTFTRDLILSDGKLYDEKYYELLKDDFFRAINHKGLNPKNYRKWGE